MALKDCDIEELLRGDLSDIDEFEDDIEMEEEDIIKQFTNMDDFINSVNLDIDNIVSLSQYFFITFFYYFIYIFFIL